MLPVAGLKILGRQFLPSRRQALQLRRTPDGAPGAIVMTVRFLLYSLGLIDVHEGDGCNGEHAAAATGYGCGYRRCAWSTSK